MVALLCFVVDVHFTNQLSTELLFLLGFWISVGVRERYFSVAWFHDGIGGV